MAQLGVILKLAANIDPILYVLSAISATYLVLYGLITWIRNHPDDWQEQLDSTGISWLIRWVREKWNYFREASNITWHL